MNLTFLKKKIRIRSCVNFRRKLILSDCMFIILCYFVLYLSPIHLIRYFLFLSLPLRLKNFTYYPSMATSPLTLSVCLSVCLSFSLPLSSSHSTSLTLSLTLSRSLTHTLSLALSFPLSLSLLSLSHPLTLSLLHSRSI